MLNVLNQKDLIDRLFAVLDGLSKARLRDRGGAGDQRDPVDANMVQVAAYTRRTEIGIMRMVGATPLVHAAAVPGGGRAGRDYRRGPGDPGLDRGARGLLDNASTSSTKPI